MKHLFSHRDVASLARGVLLGMCLLVSGCAVSLGVTNSPASPNECSGGARNCR